MSDHAFFALSLSASGQTVFFIVRSSLYRLDRKQNRCLHGGGLGTRACCIVGETMCIVPIVLVAWS